MFRSEKSFEITLETIHLNADKGNAFSSMTNCIETGKSLTKLLSSYEKGPKLKIKFPRGFLTNFQESSQLEKLLDTSDRNEHSLFHFAIYPDMHSFVVEKFFDEDHCKYRVYQSWQSRFNLMEWLGMKPWQLDKIDCDKENQKMAAFYKMLNEQYRLYGQGKVLTQEEVKQFLSLTFSFCANHKSVKWYCKPDEMGFIDVYDIKPTAELAEENAKVKRSSESEVTENTISFSRSSSPHFFSKTQNISQKQLVKKYLASEALLNQSEANGSISNKSNLNISP